MGNFSMKIDFFETSDYNFSIGTRQDMPCVLMDDILNYRTLYVQTDHLGLSKDNPI